MESYNIFSHMSSVPLLSLQATLWEVGEEELSVQRSVKQQDSVLGVGQWAENLVISSTFVTVNSLTDSNQRRIVADDTQEDESLTVREYNM